MSSIDKLCDPRRTVPAGRMNRKIHCITQVGKKLMTHCGREINGDNALVLLQRPEQITCPKCRKKRDL